MPLNILKLFGKEKKSLQPPKCPECEGPLMQRVFETKIALLNIVECTVCAFRREVERPKVRLVVDNTANNRAVRHTPQD